MTHVSVIDPARKGHPGNDDGDQCQQPGDKGRERTEQTAILHVDDQEEPVQPTPEDKIPPRAVPQSGEQHRCHQAAGLLQRTASIAA
jgi:hypothetical protein